MGKRKSILLISLALIMNCNIFLSETLANPLPIPIEYDMGGIFTNSTSSFNLTNANVIFDIDSTDFSNNIGISFEGNYTIFNPNNITEIMIVAPFSVNQSVINSNCIVEVNNSPIIFDVGYSWEFGIEDWVMDYSWFEVRTYIVCNITIPENSSQTIRYEFNGLMPNPLYADDKFSIFYDLETSKAWSGNITERVEFNVKGKIPNSYSEWTEGDYDDRCIVLNTANGRTYTWEWDNEKINTRRVGIIYSGKMLRSEIILIIILSISISVPSVIAVIIFVVIKKKRKKRI